VKLKVTVPRFPRGRASRRVLLWGGLAVGLMVLWMTAPLALRRLEFFRVRQVEFVGIRYLDAEQVLAALELAPQASVFDDAEMLAARLRKLDGVADASVLRRPPASLKVIVREIEPVALVASSRGSLAVVDAGGRPLPFDPAAGAGAIDLPVVQAADSAVVGVLARIQLFDPALFQMIDAARRLKGERADVILELGGGAHRVLLASDAAPEVIQAVMIVAKDLTAKKRPYVELDARYAGQVVVRRRGAGIA
jgi:cell division septal protein FtsQ